MSRDQGFLFDIWEASNDIIEFSQGITKPEFVRNKLVHSAIIQKLLNIGEATKLLSKKFRSDHSHTLEINGWNERQNHS